MKGIFSDGGDIWLYVSRLPEKKKSTGDKSNA